MKDCVFCKIINKEIPTKFVHKDEDIFVFHDIHPKAPTHLLIVPRPHINTFLDLGDNHFSLLTKIIKVVQRLVRDKKLESGYQVVINGGRHQEIDHLHFHLLADQSS
ncbi:MAG: HIT domain-containing protein [bacterium]|nr:HIT domain-containing protein [bacterium]